RDLPAGDTTVLRAVVRLHAADHVLVGADAAGAAWRAGGGLPDTGRLQQPAARRHPERLLRRAVDCIGLHLPVVAVPGEREGFDRSGVGVLGAPLGERSADKESPTIRGALMIQNEATLASPGTPGQ